MAISIRIVDIVLRGLSRAHDIDDILLSGKYSVAVPLVMIPGAAISVGVSRGYPADTPGNGGTYIQKYTSW